MNGGSEKAILEVFPTIVRETTDNLFNNNLLQLLSTKPPTDSCISAARKRMTFEHLPDWSGIESVDPWAAEHNKGVPLELEIKTAFFLTKTKNGEEIFIAAHIPAHKNLVSNGIIKSELKENLGVEITGDLDKSKALAVLNGKLKPLMASFKNEDKLRLIALKKTIMKASKDSSFGAYIKPLEAHIEKPEVEFGELNPWTLLMLSTYSSQKEWQAQSGVKEVKIIHLVDHELASREGVSTTNAGSRYVSMAIGNTKRAFEYLKFALDQIHEKDFKSYMVSDNLEKKKQL
jgi:hypothetical protein